MTTKRCYIEDICLSKAWYRALNLVSARGTTEMTPLIVSITGFDDGGNVQEDLLIRDVLNNFLIKNKLQGVETVANTIFPSSLWNPKNNRSELFKRYKKIFPRLKKLSSKNKKGLYFDRMIQNGSQGHPNQLEFIINQYRSRNGVRRSMLQVAIFDPKEDHSPAAQMGFPCLQHITFAPSSDGKMLSINALYATQYTIERAYGNYLGLCNLGKFVAKELNIKLKRMTCFTGIAIKDPGISKQKLKKEIHDIFQKKEG